MTKHGEMALLSAPDLIPEERKRARRVYKAFVWIDKGFHQGRLSPSDLSFLLHPRIGIQFALDSDQLCFVLGLARDYVAGRPLAGEPTPDDFGLTQQQIEWYHDQWRGRFKHPVRAILGSIVHGFGILDQNRRARKRFESALFEYAKAVFEYRQTDKLRRHEFWYALSPWAFEIELGNLFRRVGWEVAVTKVSRDSGVDLWLSNGQETVPVQCKHWAKPAGVQVVQEFYGTLLHVGAARGVLVITSGFTTGAQEFATGKPILLMDVGNVLDLSCRGSTERAELLESCTREPLGT